MGDKLNRRELLSTAAKAAAALVLSGCSRGSEKTDKTKRIPRKSSPSRLAVVTEKDYSKAVESVIARLGGMSSFVRKGDFVVIKPNIAWARTPDAAATTHPAVVSAVVRLVKEAGAGDILVIDHTIDQPSDMVLAMTGIREAAEKAGARVMAAQNQSMYRRIDIPSGKVLKNDEILKDVLKADVFINLPKAKVHGQTKLTLGLKNLMGINWNRQAWHQNGLDQCIADLATAVKPDLTILDATRLLLTNGPKGPGNTRDLWQIAAGTDPVAVDAYGATLFEMKPEEIDHIQLAYEAGLGEINYTKVMVDQG